VSEGSRIDKWLWGARFFKTRSLARDAVAGGKVELNGHGVKPGRTVKAGDQLSIQRGDERWLVRVEDITDQRVSAELAALRYHEDPASREQRMLLAEQRKLDRQSGVVSGGRPDKRQRRQIIDFIRRKP
jgi:ribosome-associated heat shock protein Hsp15